MRTDLIPLRETLPADQNPALVYLAGLDSEHSRRTMRAALDTIAGLVAPGATCATFPWHALRFQHTAAIRAQLAQAYAPATANKMLSAVRGALKAAWGLGYIDAEDYHRAVAVAGVKGETLPAGRDVAAGEIAALMAACEADPTPAGPRDAAILALQVGCGLRRAEVVALDLADYDAATGRLAVRGKRNKERAVFVTGGAGEALADWLYHRGAEPGALFWRVLPSGQLRPGRLSAQTVYDLNKRRAAQAGVKDFSPHDLRRTFAGDLLDAGADLSLVSKIMGHASPGTTARYDRRPDAAKRHAAELLHIPYRRRWKTAP